jgi:GAF domain-containing protein
MALPLRVRGRVVGALDVQSVAPNAFTAEDATVLQTMADQLAFAIENARLIERTEAQLRELSRVYGEYSTAAWAELASPERLQAYAYDRIDVLPVEELPTFDLALERGETVVATDPEAGSVLAIPLRVHGQVIGAIGVQETGDTREWSPHEIAFAEAIGEQVAQALDSARLFAETQRSAQQTQALYETSRALSSSLEEESLMRAILEAMNRTLGCEYVLISTVDEEMATIGIRHGVWHGEFDVFPEWIEKAQYSLDQPDILTDIYRTGRTEIIDGWDERLNREIYEKFGHERFLRVFAPIRIRDRTLGVIEIGHDKRRKERLGEDEMQMLAAFVDQAATALENVRLFEQAQRRAERERRIYEITTRLRRSPDIATILRTAVDELGQALQTDRAVVRLRTKPREEQQDIEKALETGAESPEG